MQSGRVTEPPHDALFISTLWRERIRIYILVIAFNVHYKETRLKSHGPEGNLHKIHLVL